MQQYLFLDIAFIAMSFKKLDIVSICQLLRSRRRTRSNIGHCITSTLLSLTCGCCSLNKTKLKGLYWSLVRCCGFFWRLWFLPLTVEYACLHSKSVLNYKRLDDRQCLVLARQQQKKIDIVSTDFRACFSTLSYQPNIEPLDTKKEMLLAH